CPPRHRTARLDATRRVIAHKHRLIGPRAWFDLDHRWKEHFGGWILRHAQIFLRKFSLKSQRLKFVPLLIDPLDRKTRLPGRAANALRIDVLDWISFRDPSGLSRQHHGQRLSVERCGSDP